MVKRTTVVLGILALTMVAGTSFAFWGGMGGGCCGPAECPPLYLPVDCPTMPAKTIVKTWAVKIEGPCPAPGAGCGPAMCRENRGFDLCCIVNAIATPFDWLFGGFDGFYGCCPDGACGAGGDGPCGPCYGPVACALAGIPTVIGSPLYGGVFGAWW